MFPHLILLQQGNFNKISNGFMSFQISEGSTYSLSENIPSARISNQLTTDQPFLGVTLVA